MAALRPVLSGRNLQTMFHERNLALDEQEKQRKARKAARRAETFNMGNALVEAATAFLSAGGPTNPAAYVAATAAAVGSERGTEFKPLESAGKGLVQGMTTPAVGAAQAGESLVSTGLRTAGAYARPENLPAAINTLRAVGTPESSLKTVQTVQSLRKMASDLKAKQLREDQILKEKQLREDFKLERKQDWKSKETRAKQNWKSKETRAEQDWKSKETRAKQDWKSKETRAKQDWKSKETRAEQKHEIEMQEKKLFFAKKKADQKTKQEQVAKKKAAKEQIAADVNAVRVNINNYTQKEFDRMMGFEFEIEENQAQETELRVQGLNSLIESLYENLKGLTQTKSIDQKVKSAAKSAVSDRVAYIRRKIKKLKSDDD